MACQAEASFDGESPPSLWASARQSSPSADACGEGWWEVLVMLQFVASGLVLWHPIYSRAAGSLPRKLASRAGAWVARC